MAIIEVLLPPDSPEPADNSFRRGHLAAVPWDYMWPGEDLAASELSVEDSALVIADRRDYIPRNRLGPSALRLVESLPPEVHYPEVDPDNPDLSGLIASLKADIVPIFNKSHVKEYGFKEGQSIPPVLQALMPLIPQNQRPGEKVEDCIMVRKNVPWRRPGDSLEAKGFIGEVLFIFLDDAIVKICPLPDAPSRIQNFPAGSWRRISHKADTEVSSQSPQLSGYHLILGQRLLHRLAKHSNLRAQPI